MALVLRISCIGWGDETDQMFFQSVHHRWSRSTLWLVKTQISGCNCSGVGHAGDGDGGCSNFGCRPHVWRHGLSHHHHHHRHHHYHHVWILTSFIKFLFLMWVASCGLSWTFLFLGGYLPCLAQRWTRSREPSGHLSTFSGSSKEILIRNCTNLFLIIW